MEHKMAYLLVVCCALLHMTAIGSDIFFFHMVDAQVILATQAIVYLLYPLIGWLADVLFTRYKLILSSFVMMIVATMVMIIVGVLIMKFSNKFLLTFSELSIILTCVGLGMFESTAIQFGMDQMPEASSRQLTTFIQWYYWSCNVGQVAVTFISMGIVAYYSDCRIEVNSIDNATIMQNGVGPYSYLITSTVVLFLAILQLMCACAGLCLLIYSKRHFNIDQVRQEMHPLKLIFKVLQYAWKHKCPERRSAFTYWEEDIPPRIDLGKSKYGGPFTTEEVEDTKTFFSILLLLFTLLGFHLSGHGYSSLDQLMRHQCPSHWVMLFLVDPMRLTFLTIVIGIPVYQVIKLCCQRFHPNMLKRMGFIIVHVWQKNLLRLVCYFLANFIKTTCSILATPVLTRCSNSCYCPIKNDPNWYTHFL